MIIIPSFADIMTYNDFWEGISGQCEWPIDLFRDWKGMPKAMRSIPAEKKWPEDSTP